jgi:hypothetical protein
MRFLLDGLPEVWSPEFAGLVRQIAETRGLDLAELEIIAEKIERLRAAVASVEEAESEA